MMQVPSSKFSAAPSPPSPLNTATATAAPSSTASTSSSPYRRHAHGLSPRQRRLLEASARAKKAAAASSRNNNHQNNTNTNNIGGALSSPASPIAGSGGHHHYNSHSNSHSPSTPNSAAAYSPSSPATPARSNTASSNISTPNELKLKVPLSPIHSFQKSNSKSNLKSNSNNSKPSNSAPPLPTKQPSSSSNGSGSGSGSGASTAVLTEATTASIENGMRRLQLKKSSSQQQQLKKSSNNQQLQQQSNDDADADAGKGEAVAFRAMRGKVGDRIRAFSSNGNGNKAEEEDVSFPSPPRRYSSCESVGNSIIHEEEEEHPIHNHISNGNGNTSRWNEEIGNGPLHQQITQDRNIPTHPNRMINQNQRKMPNNNNNNNFPFQERRTPKKRGLGRLSSWIRHPSDEIDIDLGSVSNRMRKTEAGAAADHDSRQKQSPISSNRFPSDEVIGVDVDELRYYQITFKGVVSLLPNLDSYDNDPPSPQLLGRGGTRYKTNNDSFNNSQHHHEGRIDDMPITTTTSTTYHVGYGEIVATFFPEIIIPINHGQKEETEEGEEAGKNKSISQNTLFVRAIRVDSIITGGYAAGATGTGNSVAGKDDHEINLLNESSLDQGHDCYGYLLLSSSNNNDVPSSNTKNDQTTAIAIAEPLPIAISKSLTSSVEHGPFQYSVAASSSSLSSPVAVLSGPSVDAVGLGLGLLPDTVHEVSLRISIPVQPPKNNQVRDNSSNINRNSNGTNENKNGNGNGNGTNDDETLVDDADPAGRIQFLRLAQRRGWVADRRIDVTDDGTLRVSYLMQDVTNNVDDYHGSTINANTNNNNNNNGSRMMDDTSISMSFEDASSLNSSALNSTATNSSFYSSLMASSVATPRSVKAQRRRNRRRRQRDNIGNGDSNNNLRSMISTQHHHQQQQQHKPHDNQHQNQNQHHAVGESFDDAGSSIIGAGGGGGGDRSTITLGHNEDNSSNSLLHDSSFVAQTNNHHQYHQQPPPLPHNPVATKSYYLMRVIAPAGLKILDAPHFQVSNLIHHTPSPTTAKMNLRRNISPTGNASPAAGISPFARTNAMIGSTSLSEHSPTTTPIHGGGGRKRNSHRVRYLARGQIFEASHRMEITGDSSLYTNGQGLIKLADGSGWAIIPHEEDLVAQFKRFYRDNNNGKGKGKGDNENNSSVEKLENVHEMAAYEEIGNATIPISGTNHNSASAAAERRSSPQKKDGDDDKSSNVIWLRIVNPTNGIKVLLPPMHQKHPQRQERRPATTQQRDSPHNTTPPPKHHLNHGINQTMSHNDSSFSEVGTSSMVSSSFFDSVWSRVTTNSAVVTTPTKDKERDYNSSAVQGRHHKAASTNSNSPKQQQQPAMMLPVIPCGLVVPVERWESTTSSKSFVRLHNSQGWIPRRLGETTYAHQLTEPPEIRIGSFWFRVKSASGLHVHHGPSINAPIIQSQKNDGVSFRFECGEFLRASEVITTVFRKEGGSNTSSECFAKLYRRHNNHHDIEADSIGCGQKSSSLLLNRHSSLQSLTAPGEWVQVHDRNDYNDNARQEPLLEEYSAPPTIERNRDGWRYSALVNGAGLNIRRGPSMQANVVPGELIRQSEHFLVSEKVTAVNNANNDGGGGGRDETTWLRLKSGRGWVPTVGDDGRASVAESMAVGMLPGHDVNIDSNSSGIRDRNNDVEHSHRMVRQILENGNRKS